MPRLKQENRVFAKSFETAQKGHAVWPRVLSNVLSPGTYGYVNGNGDWVAVIQLTDTDAVVSAGLEPLEGLSVEDDGGLSTWSPKMSESVSGRAIHAGISTKWVIILQAGSSTVLMTTTDGLKSTRFTSQHSYSRSLYLQVL